jgi:hypothetical protein
MVPLIDVKKAGLERGIVVIGKTESEKLLVEGKHFVDQCGIFHAKDDVSQAKRTGSEPGHRSAGTENLAGNFSIVERLQAVARRVLESYEIGDFALVGEGPAASGHPDLTLLEPCAERVERTIVGDLPSKEVNAIVVRLVDDDTLTAIVHSERDAGTALVDTLQSEMARPVAGPILEFFRANAHVS